MSKIKARFIDYDPATLEEVGGKLGVKASTSGGGTFTVSVINTSTTAVKDFLYVITANLTLTLPASPTVNDCIKVCNLSGVKTCSLGRNGLKIMGLAEDLTLDKLNAGFEIVYVNSTIGWVII